MNHEFHHNKIIKRAKGRLSEGYTERHHIIPRCMAGTNDPDNLVDLTAREHYVIHQLLVKIYPENGKLVQAAHMMTMNLRGRRSKNRSYGWLRKKHSASMSEIMRGNTNGSGNKGKPSPRKGIPRTEEWKANHSRIMKGRVIGPPSEEHKEKIRLGMLGKNTGPLSEEHKQKISAAVAGKPWSTARRTSYENKYKKTGVL